MSSKNSAEKTASTPTEAILIPDQHIRAGEESRRFIALGNLVSERTPDYIINLGDQCDFSMLYGVKNNKRWKYDWLHFEHVFSQIIAAQEANHYMIKEPIERVNKKRKKAKKKLYCPETVYLKGNHCSRLDTYWKVNESEMEDMFGSIETLTNLEGYYGRISKYQQPVVIEGVLISHNVSDGFKSMATPEDILGLSAQSTITAHTHKGDFTTRRSLTGKPLFCLQAGWFFDPEGQGLDWVKENSTFNWWNGVIYLHGLKGDGSFDPEFISTERLLEEYL